MSLKPSHKQKALSRSILAGIVAHGGAAAADDYVMTNSVAIAPAVDTPATRTVEFDEPGVIIEDVIVSVGFTKCSDTSYSAGSCLSGSSEVGLDDIEFTLESPGATTVTLMPFGTGSHYGHNDGMFNIFKAIYTFDDSAAEVVGASPGYPELNAELIWQPTGSLSDFDGEELDGTWTLNLQYRSDEPGSVDRQLAVEEFTVSVVPEPGATTLSFAALASLSGLAELRRRRRNL